MAGRTGERTRAARPSPTTTGKRTSPPPKSKASKTQAAMAGHAAVREAREAVLTAAAIVYDSESKPMAPLSGGLDVAMVWQTAVLGYVKAVPELGAGTAFMGNACSMVGLELGRRNRDGTVDDAYKEIAGTEGKERVLVEGIDPKVAEYAEEAIASLRAEIGGQAELLRGFGEKLFLIGEGYLVPKDSPGGLTFEVLSRWEVRQENGKWFRVHGPGASGTGTDELAAPPIRIYRPDPQWSSQPTSSIRSCLEVLEELVILTRLVRGAALSRMSLSGMLILADEADEPLDPTDSGDGDGAEQTNPLAVDIIQQGIKAIDDPASPAAFMPYLLQIPFEYIDKGTKFIEFAKDDSMVVRRDEAVARLARGIDLPYEVIVGHQSTTFANAAQISLDTYRIHIQPPLTTFVDAATAAVVWPYIAKKMNVAPDQIQREGYPPEILQVGIRLNPDRLTSKPDRTKDVIEAYKSDRSQTAIANSELRDVLGLDPNGGPGAEETARRVEQIQLVNEKITVGAPTPEPGAPASMASEALLGLVYQIAGAAEQTVERSIEKVGTKLRQRATRGTEAEMILGRETHEIARVLGPERTQRLLDGDPVAAEIRAFTGLVRRWATEAKHPEPDTIAETFNAFLTGVIQKRLFGIGPEVSPEICRPLVLGVPVVA